MRETDAAIADARAITQSSTSQHLKHSSAHAHRGPFRRCAPNYRWLGKAVTFH